MTQRKKPFKMKLTLEILLVVTLIMFFVLFILVGLVPSNTDLKFFLLSDILFCIATIFLYCNRTKSSINL